MQRTNNIQNILLLLFAVYYAQGSLYAQGSIISQGILLLIFGISGFYLLKTLVQKNNKNTFYKAWSALIVLNVVGFVFTGTMSNPLHFSMFKGILLTSITFYPFYYFSQKEVLRAKDLIRFFILMLPITILQYFFNANQILSERLSSNTDLVNNIAYSFVALIPFVFLFKQKKLYSIASMAVLMFFIIQGGKRGALIAGVIGLIFFIYYQLKTVDKKHRFRSYAVVFIGVIALGYFAYDVFLKNEFLIDRMQSITDGNSSGRDVIFSNIFNAWLNSDNMFKLIFGFGFASSLTFTGGAYAHNDWLELLSNFGLLGVVIYALLFYTAVKYMLNKNINIDKQLLIMTVVCIWFFTTLVSMYYTSNGGYVQTIILAYLIGSKSYKLV